jgi:hypothetical protein
MSDIHTIRLRGPWELTPLSTAHDSQMLPGGEPLGFVGETITQQLPAAWDAVLPGFRGTVRYTRRFGKPTNLEAHERIWLCVEDAAGSVSMMLNGEALKKGPGPFSIAGTFFDVTNLLRERNLLQVEVTQLDRELPAGLVGEVRLEIRRSGFPA